MREPIENISHLQIQLNDLQLENQILKNILDNAGISYGQELMRLHSSEELCDYDLNQGARIRPPIEITEKMAVMFYSRFWGRQDVYAKRSEKKDTGEASYFTQCHNFWMEVCPKKHRQKINCKDCKYQSYKQLTKDDILMHLRGRSYNASDVIGVYPLLTDGTCRFLVYDFDNHERGAEKKDFANEDDTWIEEVEAMRKICVLNGIDPLVERSRSGKGAHIWIFFDNPIPASLVRKFGIALLDKGAEQVNLKSFKYYDRMLPAQDVLPEGGVGNLIALPLQGKALKEGNSAFIDRNWNAYPNQWEILWSKPRLSKEFLEAKIREWTSSIEDMVAIESGEDREKPWEKSRRFSGTDVDGKMHIILSNGIYVDNLNLRVALQNKIRRMAAISNPVYYKNQAIGTSNYNTSRWIYLGQDHLSGYIEIPRGLFDTLIDNIEQAKIPYEIEDERQEGRTIDVVFKGELREEQKIAMNEMLQFDNGILYAATAFGKTVVCSAIIAEKKVNTLIILESSALMEQWKEALEKFLDIKCRKANIKPDVVVCVATIKALKYHGGASKESILEENMSALEKGMNNLYRHIDNIRGKFGLNVIVAINKYNTDQEKELEYVQNELAKREIVSSVVESWAKGGEGAIDISKKIVEIVKDKPERFEYIYDLNETIVEKINKVAMKIYGAKGVIYPEEVTKKIEKIEEMGYGNLPVCIAKTQYSFSDNAKNLECDEPFEINIRDVELKAGAGFIVVLAGKIMTMPGLPKIPSAENIDIDENGDIVGIF